MILVPRIRSFRGWLHAWSIVENPWDLALVYLRARDRAILRGRGPLAGQRFKIESREFGRFPDAFLRTILLRHGATMEPLPGGWLVTLRGGLTLVTEESMLSLVEVFVNDAYMVNSLDLRGKVCVDIGAYIGDSTLLLARRGSKVFAFEPSPRYFALARRNIDLNGMQDRIVLLNEPASAEALCELVRIHGIGEIELVKMDCEGCEYSVLSGFESSWLDLTRRIAMEFHASPEPLVQYLRAHGFSVRVEGGSQGGYLWALRSSQESGTW